ncbi:MAG: hypothetical protein SCALA701_12440 [Candidatus Scalindua sp.]|nr:MAG: hypothetical protein SCALA701_12440 [Candidatus Scalindua sp.]
MHEKPAFAVPVSGVFPPTFSENSGGFQVEYFGNDTFGKNQDSTATIFYNDYGAL